MRVNILNKIHERNLNISIVASQLPCTYSNFHKLCNEKTNSIRFDILEPLCKILNCGVEELLIIEDTEEDLEDDYTI